MQILGSVYLLFFFEHKLLCINSLEKICFGGGSFVLFFFSFVGIRHQAIYILSEDAALLLPSLGGA